MHSSGLFGDANRNKCFTQVENSQAITFSSAFDGKTHHIFHFIWLHRATTKCIHFHYVILSYRSLLFNFSRSSLCKSFFSRFVRALVMIVLLVVLLLFSLCFAYRQSCYSNSSIMIWAGICISNFQISFPSSGYSLIFTHKCICITETRFLFFFSSLLQQICVSWRL